MTIDWTKIRQSHAQAVEKDAKRRVEYYETHPQEVSSMATEIGVNHPATLYIASLQWVVGDQKRQIEAMETEIEALKEEVSNWRAETYAARGE